MFVPIPIVILVGFTLVLLIGIIIRLSRKHDPLLGDRHAALRPTQALPPRGLAAASVVELSPEMKAQVSVLIKSGRKIEAIKLIRDITHLGLKESKDLMDALE